MPVKCLVHAIVNTIYMPLRLYKNLYKKMLQKLVNCDRGSMTRCPQKYCLYIACNVQQESGLYSWKRRFVIY